MMRINLLPWRVEEQHRRLQHFVLSLVLALIVGIAIVYWSWLMAGGAVDAQQARNSYLRQQIGQLNVKIRSINKLKKTRANLLARMRVIETLERSRPLVVHLFDQLAVTLPDSVYLTEIKNRDGTLSIKGIANSPSGVSNYMRNIAASPWLAPPNLEVVRTSQNGGSHRSDFAVSSKLVSPAEKTAQNPEEAEQAEGGP
ncbi:MAG: PilN domain-containing protein [Gammaproteobacteria bacterium]